MNKAYMNRSLHQKVKDTENQVKDKIYYTSTKVKKAASQAQSFVRKKPSTVDHYVSITIALLLITASYVTAAKWMFWVGTISIVCSMILLIISKKKARP
ncbi:hypothetical protein RE628_11985 [Paenibacillus sp. D2_2]|uniref:hypothetical protein n=1 Tax=Paenibacillus sp. D2_2 TaxID=3073092 RepID=UPI00281582A3|nr:hypothetical protein [Paenibacillus sp. D2_2]WMT42935.1 hypothetical protein RE628_11985 [Paenibacillus sp. D2_2]